MELSALSLRLVMAEIILLGTRVEKSYTHREGAVLLRVSPNRSQLFEYEPVSFHCESADGSARLKAVRNATGLIQVCDLKKGSSGSCCSINEAYEVDSGEYWCETEAGERSDTANVTVTGGPVILESPALPVFEGEAVALRCRTRTASSSSADFYKDGVLVQPSPAEEMRIDHVSTSHEGLYSCSVSGAGTSPGSRLLVRVDREDEDDPDCVTYATVAAPQTRRKAETGSSSRPDPTCSGPPHEETHYSAVQTSTRSREH